MLAPCWPQTGPKRVPTTPVLLIVGAAECGIIIGRFSSPSAFLDGAWCAARSAHRPRLGRPKMTVLPASSQIWPSSSQTVCRKPRMSHCSPRSGHAPSLTPTPIRARISNHPSGPCRAVRRHHQELSPTEFEYEKETPQRNQRSQPPIRLVICQIIRTEKNIQPLPATFTFYDYFIFTERHVLPPVF